ncbi:MAG TPA: cytochrome b5 domain-containing protein, partial [Polyangiaceae bacterium]|nr:cytochrome b5 domain-containing protein [Polyangiaceae bacterium]
EYGSGGSVGQDSCELLFRLFENETERAFFLGVQEVTARFQCIPALVRMQRAMAQCEHSAVIAAVEEITTLWREVVEDVFMRFDTRIDPADWAATVGTWTASPFPGRDGFSGMFFPAFHMLDVLIGRVRYASTMGKLIVHTRGELLPVWQELFEAIGEADLRTYCDTHGREQPELLRALVGLQDSYQHFFLVHRRKVFAFEYQGIVTGRNSTNAGISVDIQKRAVESVFNLATWNEIDDLLLDSGTERPLERLSTPAKCPFSGAPLAEDAPKTFPSPISVRCPFSSSSMPPAEPALVAPEPLPETVHEALPSWRPLPTPPALGLHGIELESLPVAPQVGDRVALWLDADGQRKVEGDLMGSLAPPYAVRTGEPVVEVHRVEVLRGLFARKPGSGARARHTEQSPVLVLAEGRHSVLATTLAPHARAELFVVVEGAPAEKQILTAHGVPSLAVTVVPALDEISAEDVSEACGYSRSALRELRDRVLIYISGGPDFVRRANSWLEAAFLEPHEPVTRFLSELRVSKRYRPTVQPGPAVFDEGAVMYPWDVIGARRYPLRVVLEGRVLDLTEFQAVHYGGTPILRMLAGTDVSSEFSRAHPDGQIRMPDVHAVASFCVPRGLEKITRLAFIVARSANVLSLLDDMLLPYQAQVRSRTQRLCRVLEALDVETLWSNALARACGMVIQPTVQQALRSSHARSLAVLESSLRSTSMPDLSTSFAVQYTGLYEDVLQNLVRGLRESVTSNDKPIERVALRRCFQRHVQILLEHSTVARVVEQPSSEPGFALDLEDALSFPRSPTVAS